MLKLSFSKLLNMKPLEQLRAYGRREVLEQLGKNVVSFMLDFGAAWLHGRKPEDLFQRKR